MATMKHQMLKYDRQASTLRRLQRWLAVPAMCLFLFLSACGSVSIGQGALRPTATATPDPQLLPARTEAQGLLTQYQQLIGQTQAYGQDVSWDQQRLDQDQQDFQHAQTTQAYQALSSRIQAQEDALHQAIVANKTSYDLNQLQNLIGQTASTNDYEYRNADDAYLQEQARFQQAKTEQDYQAVDQQVQILLHNLHALLTNLNDSTAHNQPHATDLQLMQTYQVSSKVIVVSLTEQTLRMYENGQLVGWMYVVTGQQDAQTPPGLWHISSKATDQTFKSGESEGSALWYPPTHINYALGYHAGGYFLHDATWRSYFGPGANLPHNDETSGQYSNNGSHGCINMNLANAKTLYDWADKGIPVIVY